MVQSARHALYARLAMTRRAAGLDEADYRALLAKHGAQAHGGRPSASTMSYRQLLMAASELQRLAGQSAAPSIVERAAEKRRPQWRKIAALWCTLADRHVVRARGEQAMLAFCRRFVRTKRIEWATAWELSQCIEALKEWDERTTPATGEDAG